MADEEAPPVDPVLAHVSRQLAFDFGSEFTEETIQELVAESFSAFSNARVKNYVPLLLHRSARERLRAAAARRSEHPTGTEANVAAS